MQLFSVISLPPFSVILVGGWNEDAHRYFISYRVQGDFRHTIGLPVVDEFATFSTPVFFGPSSQLGKLYNLGITLGHQRNSEMPIDQGWPPICIGLPDEDPVPADWETDLLTAIKNEKPEPVAETGAITEFTRIGPFDIYATNAPLLPRQLRRICELSTAPLSIAFSTGNRITARKGKVLNIDVVSESLLAELISRFRD